MKSRWIKTLVVSLSVIVCLAIASVISFQVFFKLPQPSYSGTEKLDGLTAQVEVRTDEHGIPHIFAQNEEDLFFAQGYITARERMFQMDITRLAGRGELSTLLGEATVNTDKYFKTLGLYRTAEAEYANLSSEDKSAIDAYTRGVNAYINKVKYLPCEYVILGVKPQLWKPQDSLVAGILMIWRLNMPNQFKLYYNQIALIAGNDKLNYLLPSLPQFAPTISTNTETKVSGALREPVTAEPFEYVSNASEFYSPVLMNIRFSSWYIFSGSRTTTGKPVFAGSPDLEAAIPSLFYLVHLKGGAYDVIGGSIAGVPGVNALGFNGHFAWSITNGTGDNLDYFIEKLNPDNPNQYMTEDGYKNFVTVEETLKIKTKDGIKEEKLPVKISRHGPIISDIMPGAPQNCAMMWAGQGYTGITQSVLALDKAKNFDEFHEAFGIERGASLTIGYADVDGNIGYQWIATLPIRKAGDNPIPRPGEKGEYDLVGYLPFEDHPYDYNPEKGYFASFNNMPKRADYYGNSYFLFERALRFEDIANSKDKFSVEEIRNMQLDTVSMAAKRWVPHILRVCNGVEELKPYISLFNNWNYTIDIDSSAATLWNIFYANLMRNTLEDDIGKKCLDDFFKGNSVYLPDQWLTNAIDDNNHFLWDDNSTPNVKETRDDMILKSMKTTVAELSVKLGNDPQNWAWGKVHTMTIKHTLGDVVPFLNLKPIPYPGDDFTINAGWWDRNNPCDMRNGGAIRIVVDMSNLDNMTLISPAGQSGHYLSPYYSDQVETWVKGKQIPAHYTDAKELKQLLVLEP